MLQSLAVDDVFRALADPTRRNMTERLAVHSTTVTDLATHYDISVSAVLQHVRVLERSGLVRTEKPGRARTCRVNPDALNVVNDWVAARRGHIEQRLDRLACHLAETMAGPRSET